MAEKEGIKKKKLSAGENYPRSFHLFLCAPLCRALCTIQATWTVWRYMSCPAPLYKKAGAGVIGVGGWTLFIAFSSCLVLAHCFCHAHLHLLVVSHPSPLFFLSSFSSSPLCFLSGTLPVRLYEYRRVSFKSKDVGAVGQARGAADTPLPHPEQLLNLRNRIISAKVAALFHSQEPR